MNLSSDLVSQFAKITNDNTQRSTEETILYGEIVQFGDELCVKFDGSDQMTPAVTTSAIKVGDRVSAVIKNHTAIITGNLSDPSVGSDKVRIDIDQKVGVIFTGLEAGTTIINGACIKTGTIDAQYLNLTGAIKFIDLNAELQTDIEGAIEDAENAIAGVDAALDAAEEAYDEASSARSIARSIANGTYLSGTFIDGKTITSPTIEGNEIKVYGTFQTMGHDGVNMRTTGYMGAAQGLDAAGSITLGVALSNEWSYDDYSVGDNYVIVTNGGVRLQAGGNRIIVTDEGIYLRTDTGGSGKAYYNGTEIGSGAGGTITPVWG